MPKNFDKDNSLGVFKLNSGYGSYETRMRAPQYHSNVKTELVPTTAQRSAVRKKTNNEKNQRLTEILWLIKNKQSGGKFNF